MRRFYVRFRGTRNGEWIVADSLTSAKWLYARQHGMKSLVYIIASKHA